MKIKDVTREKKDELKSVRINLKTTKSVSKWMTDNQVSPQMVFDKAIEHLQKDNEN